MNLLNYTYKKHYSGDFEFIQLIIPSPEGKIIYTLNRREDGDRLQYFLREDFRNDKTLCKFYETQESFNKAILRLERMYKNHPEVRISIGSQPSFKVN
jgi:hypothetical protein